MIEPASQLWAVVLAGGQGTRLASLTRALHAFERPKQFAVLSGSRSMLQATVDRILPLVPAERVLVIASRRHDGRFDRYEVLRFVEKPDLALARALLGQGARCNTARRSARALA